MATHPPGDLAGAVAALAGTPDFASIVDRRLADIARLTAQRVAPASYASITALHGWSPVTVSVSEELIREVDEAQYADDAGPCLEALRTGTPVAVPDTAATVQWPGFHEAAPRLGLRASVSLPLYAGRGEPIAVLNVYGRDRSAMAPLIMTIESLHAPARGRAGEHGDLPALDDGSQELVTGYAEALSIRATIKLALSVIMAGNRCTAEDAYVSLCIRAGEAGVDPGVAAVALLGSRP
ncbi:GAF domain-containing protein [Actinoplanes sp. NPDC049548]|uniref:GAF domain-containing protein n=1 Tax=Actinoplanes sp. NPDC049548 TaxID=3155152 RepID=UPI00341F1544